MDMFMCYLVVPPDMKPVTN